MRTRHKHYVDSMADAESTAHPANANPIRTSIRELFEHCGLSALEAQDLEVGVFNHTIDLARTFPFAASWVNPTFQEAYMAKARSMVVNLNPDSYVGNRRLLLRLKEGEFRPHELVDMAPDRLLPEAWEGIVAGEEFRKKGAYEGSMAAMTDIYTCGKCKKKKCTYYELQIRAQDEGTCTFIRCLNCGWRWRHG